MKNPLKSRMTPYISNDDQDGDVPSPVKPIEEILEELTVMSYEAAMNKLTNLTKTRDTLSSNINSLQHYLDLMTGDKVSFISSGPCSIVINLNTAYNLKPSDTFEITDKAMMAGIIESTIGSFKERLAAVDIEIKDHVTNNTKSFGGTN